MTLSSSCAAVPRVLVGTGPTSAVNKVEKDARGCGENSAASARETAPGGGTEADEQPRDCREVISTFGLSTFPWSAFRLSLS